LSDFDPLFDLTHHLRNWYVYFKMVSDTEKLKDRFQILCSLQDSEIPADRLKLDATLLSKSNVPNYDERVAFLNGRQDAYSRQFIFENSPGMWDKVELTNPSREFKVKKPGEIHPVRPGSHHQKLLIVDGKRAFTGGMNVGLGYRDDITHSKLADFPWHDVFVKVEGKEVLAGFIKSYAVLWNQERVKCRDFLMAAYDARKDKPKKVFRETTDLKETDVPAKAASGIAAGITSQIHRTLSGKSSPSGVPVPLSADILNGTLTAIFQARDFIYLENQYFREKAIFDAILQRKAESAGKGLNVIIVVPGVIKEVARLRKGEALDAISAHGLFLQQKLFAGFLAGMKGDAGIFRLARTDDKDIYIHSKLFVVDDVFASIGSANANPRSYRMDSELDFVWYDPATVRKLRVDLWNEFLGKPPGMDSWKPTEFLKRWVEIAYKNEKVSAKARKGFVMPFLNLLPKEGKEFPFDVSPYS
jgi:phosphatidylserine/phosphatidylglycerophosphate/cardiolipin synthase-like enzyme